VTLEAGDLLLVQTVTSTIEYVTETGDLVVVDDASDRLLEGRIDEVAPLSPKTPIALAIMAGVVGTRSARSRLHRHRGVRRRLPHDRDRLSVDHRRVRRRFVEHRVPARGRDTLGVALEATTRLRR